MILESWLVFNSLSIGDAMMNWGLTVWTVIGAHTKTRIVVPRIVGYPSQIRDIFPFREGTKQGIWQA